MNNKNNSKVLKFPSNLTQNEKQVEAILFSSEAPLSIENIQEKLK